MFPIVLFLASCTGAPYKINCPEIVDRDAQTINITANYSISFYEVYEWSVNESGTYEKDDIFVFSNNGTCGAGYEGEWYSIDMVKEKRWMLHLNISENTTGAERKLTIGCSNGNLGTSCTISQRN